MMGTTAKYGLPYPEASDPPAGDAQIKALAEAVETIIDKGLGGTQSGAVTLTWTNAFLASTAVTFPKAYTSPPAVVASSENRYRNISVDSITTTGCMIRGQSDNNDTKVTGTTDATWIANGVLA